MTSDITKKMLRTIREGVEKNRKLPVEPLIVEENEKIEDNFLTRSKILMEEAENSQKKTLNEDKSTFNDENHGNAFPITKTTPQFGDVRVSQEESILKTIGQQVKFGDNSLVYYPDSDDLVINAEMPSLNSSFQFRYNDPSGCGCYIFCNGLQLTDENARTIGKIKDAFTNFRQGLINDNDLMDKLKKVAERDK